MSDEEWLMKFEELKKEGFPFYQCSWIGGEPLLRKGLIEQGMRYFRSNLVTTNGMMELPNWPDVNFYISIDGPCGRPYSLWMCTALSPQMPRR